MSKGWINPEEIGELFRRAKYLVDHHGFTRVRADSIGSWGTRFENPTFIVSIGSDELLYIEDRVAFVLIADYEGGGVKEVYGSTAKNVLLDMRRHMLLEDLANV